MLNVVGPYFCFTFSPGWCNGSDAAGYNVEFAQYQDCPWCTYNENEPVYGGAWSMPNQGVCTNSRYDQTRCGYVDPYNYGWINITVGGTGHSTFVNSCAQGATADHRCSTAKPATASYGGVLASVRELPEYGTRRLKPIWLPSDSTVATSKRLQ